MILVVALVAAAFAAAVIFGAPYVPVLRSEIEPLLTALNLKPGQTLIDLGCGDGRMLKAAARQGVKGVGYEINPILFAAAVINCWPVRDKVEIKLGNYWSKQLPPADAVFVFLIGHFMARLDEFLGKQIKRPTRVLSYIYPVPNKKPLEQGPNYYLYKY